MTVVVKIGGARAVDPEGALADIRDLIGDGEEIVIVHGGSTAVDETLQRLDIEPDYVETPDGVVGRFTDAETMEVFEMVFGKLNLELVTQLQDLGVNAVGLSGPDGQVLSGSRKSAVRVLEDGKRKIRRGDHSGTIESVNDDLLTLLLEAGYTPVVTVPMFAEEGTAVNSDADRAAAAVAGALGATLVELTDVDGVYRDPEDPATRIDRVETAAEFGALEDAAEGFMTRKVMAAKEALEAGAESVVVADANADAPVSTALDGNGTTISPGAVAPDE
jgi:acetylglutamate/LysW-gamma-L-alpha-aminoadipate kinase